MCAAAPWPQKTKVACSATRGNVRCITKSGSTITRPPFAFGRMAAEVSNLLSQGVGLG
jgi:hypothetical protein